MRLLSWFLGGLPLFHRNLGLRVGEEQGCVLSSRPPLRHSERGWL